MIASQLHWPALTTRRTPASCSARRARPPRIASCLQGRPNGDRVTLTLAVDDLRVHDDDIANPPEIPEPPALRDRAAPAIIMLQGNFRQGVIEPILDASWAPAASTFYYEAQSVVRRRTILVERLSGRPAELLQGGRLRLGPAAGPRDRGQKGAFNVRSRSSLRPSACGRMSIEIESFKAGLRDYVETPIEGRASIPSTRSPSSLRP